MEIQKLRILVFYLLLLFVFVNAVPYDQSEKPTDIATDLSGWSELGTLTVSDGAAYDILEIDTDKEDVKRMKLKALKSAVHLMSLKIIYTDGTSELHSINNRIDKGHSSCPFDLIGHYRIIRTMIFTYLDSSSNSGGAQLVILARI